jgi:putative FmdB family regulatory protein
VPTYQYACTACDHRFEAVQSFSDASLTVCPECGGALRKVFSSVGIVFKGSGFYRTDSRAGAGSTVAKGEPGSGSTEKSTPAEKSPAAASSSSSSSSSSDKKSSSSTSTSTPAAAAS